MTLPGAVQAETVGRLEAFRAWEAVRQEALDLIRRSGGDERWLPTFVWEARHSLACAYHGARRLRTPEGRRRKVERALREWGPVLREYSGKKGAA